MGKVTKPAMRLGFHGDMMKRANLFRWIREFIEAQDMGDGYYMEFGVHNGESMIEAYRTLRGVTNHYYGFDSFEGLPELTGEDQKSHHLTPGFYEGNYKSMQFDFVKASIKASSRMQDDELTLTPGFFEDSLSTFKKETLKQKGVPLVVFIDCDLYSSTVEVLKFIDDLLVTGTWVLFDDYWCFRGSPNAGEQKAINEWLSNHSRIGLQEYCNFEGWGRAFIAYEK